MTEVEQGELETAEKGEEDDARRPDENVSWQTATATFTATIANITHITAVLVSVLMLQ